MLLFCTGAGTHKFEIASKGLQYSVKRRVLDHIRPTFTLQHMQCSIETILAFQGSARLCAHPHFRSTGKKCVLDMKRRPHWPTERHVVHREAFSQPQTGRPRHAALILILSVTGKMVLFIALPGASWGCPYPPPADPWCALWGSSHPLPAPALPPAPHCSLRGASRGCHGSPATHPPGPSRLLRNPSLPPARNYRRRTWPRAAQEKVAQSQETHRRRTISGTEAQESRTPPVST